MSLVDGKTALFICVADAGRGQTAGAFFERHAAGPFVLGAGTMPALQPGPVAVQAAGWIGLSGRPKILTGEKISAPVKAVSMGCTGTEPCPPLSVNDVGDWDMPPEKTPAKVRLTCDHVESGAKEPAARLKRK